MPSDYSYCIVSERTNRGCVRQENQDSLVHFECKNGLVAVVCDGMGGHAGGGVASRVAIDTIRDFLNEHFFEDPEEAIEKAIDAANEAVLNHVKTQPVLRGMGATCVMLIVRDGKVYIGSVGDSRVYLIRDHIITQLTRDQSYVQQLVDSGQITKEEAAVHPRRNEITNCLGLAHMIPATILPEPLTPEVGDAFLLCSDGLTGMMQDEEIEKIVSKKETMTCRQRVNRLVDIANERGGYDNISVQIVEFTKNPHAVHEGMIGKEVLNYRIVSLIGKGGMGSVYLAEHKLISVQKAAIKVINAEMMNDYTREKLKEEAEHLAELNHQYIITFHDYHIDEDGTIYLIMEYADGKNLEDYIRTETGLIVQEKICPLFEPILDAVGYAHAHNLLHRDIKPSNVVITKEKEPRILDFGIATLIHEKQGKKGDRTIVGTPSYMSPEQVKGEAQDERSDIYSLGVMLHTMLTGRPPYDVRTLSSKQIREKVVHEPLPRLRSYYRHVSDRVQNVVDKATAKRPEDRYQSCAEFKKALHQAVYPSKKSKALSICIHLLHWLRRISSAKNHKTLG